jgi:iron-sulfur cluster insertion protein
MGLIIDPSTEKRIHDLRGTQGKPDLMLRITVDGGGCAGFQYKMDLTTEKGTKDQIFAECVITDDISLPFLEGSTILFEESLIGADFKIKNPNATSGCGCGTSFSVM